MLKNSLTYPRNRLDGQVMALVSGALLFTLIIFSLSVFYFVNRTEGAAWRGRQGEAARNAAGTVSGFIQRVQDALLVVSIVNPDQLASDSIELKALLQENTALLEIIRVDSSGRVLASASRDKSVLTNLITIPQSQWYLQARKGQTYIGDVQLSAHDDPYLIMAIPGADNGVVAARVQMDILWSVVNNIHFGQSGEVIVVTHTGNIIAHTNSEFVVARQTLFGRPEFSAILNAPNHEWAGQYTSFHNEQVVAAAATVSGTNWIVITELSQSEAFAYSRTAVFVLGTEAVLLLLLVSLIVARYVRLLVARPMEQLRDGTDRIGRGDLNYRIDMTIKNEIGLLASAFNTMAANLQMQRTQVEAQTIALRESEASLRRITDNMYDVITQIGPEGIVGYASPSLKWVLGIEPAELLGEMIFERIHPDDMAEALKIFSQAVVDKVRPKPFSLRYKHIDGKYLWMECATNILTDSQGEFAGAVLSSRDVSERKRMEAELRTSEQLYRLLADNANDIIWTTDLNLQITYISPAVHKLLGYTVEESLSLSLIQMLTPESAEAAQKLLIAVLSAVEITPPEQLRSDSRVMELEIHRKDGSTLWMEAQMSFLLDGLGKPTGILGVSRDIGERKRAEDSRQKAIAYEYESQRARELDILLKASEAASSSLDLDTVLLTLAAQLLELSGFESCYISEWDKEANLIYGRVDHSRVFWTEEKRDAYSLSDYPRSKEVLLTGNPIILQGDFEAEEKQWMQQFGRTAVTILALYAHEKVIGLVEIAISSKTKLFSSKSLQKCEEVIANAASSLIEPLSANDPQKLFALEEKLMRASGGEVCSFSEWDQPRNRILTCAVASNQISAMGQNSGINPEQDASRNLALQEGKTSIWVHSEGNERIEFSGDGTVMVEVESLILFPLQKGDERIGLIELYDFNHKIHVTPEQITLLRTIADKASYSIENARLLQLTQKKLDEQVVLLGEKEVLLKEIHHRVKNNLQIISSLLNLQTDKVKDTGTLRVLRDSQARVRSMALIHEKLYQSKSLAKIEFGEYVQSLAKDLFRSYQHALGDIKLKIQVDEVPLDLDYAVPCGLILNELMTNALKYAFPNGKNGTITIELRAGPGQIRSLRVADDGVGLPAGLDILNTKSLGLQLVNSLTAQVEGKLVVENSAGTDFRISFSIDALEK